MNLDRSSPDCGGVTRRDFHKTATGDHPKSETLVADDLFCTLPVNFPVVLQRAAAAKRGDILPSVDWGRQRRRSRFSPPAVQGILVRM
jgi:hypothetical protein